jgi:hypothetical protein
VSFTRSHDLSATRMVDTTKGVKCIAAKLAPPRNLISAANARWVREGSVGTPAHDQSSALVVGSCRFGRMHFGPGCRQARHRMLGQRTGKRRRLTVTGYRPMTLADLAGRLIRTAEGKVRWKLVWEFLEEYRWEPSDVQPSLLQQEPPSVGDERWDALLAALAEHLAARHDLAPRSGLSPGCLAGRGFPRSCGSSGRRRWSGHRRRSASTASTCLPETWRQHERGRRCSARPGRA